MDNNEFIVRYIPKSKGFRKIVLYKEGSEIKKFHQNVHKILYKRILPSKFAKGFIRKRSVISNAKSHLYNDIFINLDIKDFFSSINHNKLIKFIEHEFNKGKKKISKQDCIKIVESCALSKKGLGTGLILSPMLSNIYLKEFDNILYGKLKKMKLTNIIYTRYADDMTISFKNEEKIDYKRSVKSIEKIITDLLKRYGLKLNRKKTRVINLNVSNHVKITGINIVKANDNYRTLSVGRNRKDKLYYDALLLLNKDSKSEYEINRLKGLQSFILSVEGESYQNCYSENMIEPFNEKGYQSVKCFIDSL